MLIAYCVASLVIGTIACMVAGKRRPWLVQGVYAGAVIACVVTAAKLAPIVDGVVVSVAVGLYSMTFLLTDFLGEVHGKKSALRAVYLGIAGELVLVFSIYFSVAVEPAGLWGNQEAYRTILGDAPRLMIASIAAFVLAQLTDVTIFEWLKIRFKGRFLALRNNISTFLGQTVDTVVFYVIGFLWVEGVDILQLVIISCVVKYSIALVDTPFVYLCRWWANRGEEAAPEE